MFTKYSVLNKQAKIWCNNIYALHGYRNFCFRTFYSDSACTT